MIIKKPYPTKYCDLSFVIKIQEWPHQPMKHVVLMLTVALGCYGTEMFQEFSYPEGWYAHSRFSLSYYLQ